MVRCHGVGIDADLPSVVRDDRDARLAEVTDDAERAVHVLLLLPIDRAHDARAELQPDASLDGRLTPLAVDLCLVDGAWTGELGEALGVQQRGGLAVRHQRHRVLRERLSDVRRVQGVKIVVGKASRDAADRARR